jgi:hypothetical protein
MILLEKYRRLATAEMPPLDACIMQAAAATLTYAFSGRQLT